MSFYFFKKTVYNCKQATMLSLKKDEGKISLLDRLKLAYHLRFCDPCHRFIKQSHIINKAGKEFEDSFFTDPPFKLDEEAKENIIRKIKASGK